MCPSTSSSGRDKTDTMMIYIDDVLVLTKLNDDGTGDGVYIGKIETIAWPGPDHVLKVDAQSSNSVTALHMGIMSILAMPEDNPEQDFQLGSPSGYTYFPEECVMGSDMVKYKDTSVYECAQKCNNNPECAGFEYGMNYESKWELRVPGLPAAVVVIK